MPKRDWSNGFASGLIVAICAMALLFVAISSVQKAGTSPPTQSAQCGTSGHQCPQENDGGGYWWGVTQSFVSSEDTLAQWLMMVASLLAVGISGLAVYWVKRTFEVTREMAADSREVGQRQIRAYVSAAVSSTRDVIEGQTPTFMIKVSNSGQSPARRCIVRAGVFMTHGNGDDLPIRIPPPIPNGSVSYIPAGSSVVLMRHIQTPLGQVQIALLQNSTFKFVLAGYIIYRDVFGKTRRSTFKMESQAFIVGNEIPFRICSKGNHSS